MFSFLTSSLRVADAEQCKYGKNRVEADAKRLQSKEEELMKRKQEIRNRLTQLKTERRDLRSAVEAAAGKKGMGKTFWSAWEIQTGGKVCALGKSSPRPLEVEKSTSLRPPGKRSHASLSERLKKVEEDCRQKEEERVNLELELTEVKESLKKALSGGVTLGLTIQPKAGSSGLQVRTLRGFAVCFVPHKCHDVMCLRPFVCV